MENSHSQQRRGLKQLASLLLAGSLTATLLAGCGDKPAPEKDVPGKRNPQTRARKNPRQKNREKNPPGNCSI